MTTTEIDEVAVGEFMHQFITDLGRRSTPSPL